MMFPSWRPMVISSRTSGTTVFRPSSSSMMSFMRSSARGAFCLGRVVSEGLPRSPLSDHPSADGRVDGRSDCRVADGRECRAASRAAREMLAVSGIPWVTLLFLLACAWVLLAAGGMRGALSVSGLLAYGAKATPLILDRGETWRLLSANLLHKDLLHLAFNAFAIWNVGGALERAVRPADYLALIIFTALGTTVASAAGADSISLGASGIAFGVLGASATFGWRRAVRGRLRAQ